MTVRFIKLDSSNETLKIEKGFYAWLQNRKFETTASIAAAGGLGDVCTLLDCGGNRVGVVLAIDYTEEA